MIAGTTATAPLPGRRPATVAIAALVVMLAGAPTAQAMTITRAELDDDELRLRGEDAVPHATITVDGEPFETATRTGTSASARGLSPPRRAR